ncbi:hypothetical protein BofuT4_uP014540.1 [Botrytis cinerea T4]|uniref:Uncharacterized protein n=1 Tax=Botryotinia fuckeliana (strain T4) TaxID=999810 RepID=G2XN70_BOTF4|nr:hypothetical protein BofuT4_uP014540.1 [Botrytis cinerea T4]
MIEPGKHEDTYQKIAHCAVYRVVGEIYVATLLTKVSVEALISGVSKARGTVPYRVPISPAV